ncbi:tetratricopeptide repeat protein [Arcicella sp. LKC2W]|uniref:tetratricopeptide repeat-containing sensor histidine kinase n=1 Tax=Arcicella sp. LKC2W TaxID=2984198 RepID=UPI002B218C8B|nr:tetratricopeptide repeat protein [Arcicella sp. LKC2W]MEA5460000.1 tetratricopeptide repeat protein [Arcicella sp. LKC2W]
MKKIYLLLLISWSSFGQNKDSLLRVINNYKLRDTIQCERLNQFIELENDEKVWMKYNTILGQICSQKLGTSLSDKERKAYNNYWGMHFNNIGFYYTTIKGNYDSALYFYSKAVLKFKNGDNLNALAQTLQNIGTHYDYKGEPKQILNNYNQVLDIYTKTKNFAGLANIYADFGRVYCENGAINKGMEYFTKSLKISDDINDKASKARTLGFLTSSLLDQKEYQKILDYAFELIDYYVKSGDKILLGQVYHQIAFVYSELGKYKQMFQYSEKAMAIAKEKNLPSLLSDTYGLLASYYLDHNQLDSAYKFTNIELEYGRKSIIEPGYTMAIIRYANILKLKKRYREAENFGLTAYKRGENSGSVETIMQASKRLKEIYKNLNNTPLAFQYAEIEIKMKDSLNKINTKNSAIKALFKYETEAKDDEIIKIAQQKQISELESTRKTTLIYSILGAILALSAIAYFSFTRFRAKKENELLTTQLEEAKRRIEIEQKATESELKALKSQMNPHFMFNALNGIQEQFMYGDKVKANEQMGNFTYLTRQILTVSGKKKINLSTEIEILTKYLELEKMRFAEGFDYTINLSKNIDEDYHQLPPMLIQPFVENSVKHGLLHKQGDKKLSISFDLDETEENLICVVEDNGVGRVKSAEIKSKRVQQHESFSTSATEERLRLLNNDLQNQNLIVYEDLKNDDNQVIGTKVTLTIALG